MTCFVVIRRENNLITNYAGILKCSGTVICHVIPSFSKGQYLDSKSIFVPKFFSTWAANFFKLGLSPFTNS